MKTIFQAGNNKIDMDEKLDNLLDKSNHILYSTKSVFPFDLFPDELTITISQVHLTTKYFLKTQRIHSIAIRDISDVFVEATPWYATLRIIDKDFIENSVKISYLKKDEAVYAKQIIQGLLVALKEGVDVTQVNEKHLTNKLADLGSPSSPSNKN